MRRLAALVSAVAVTAAVTPGCFGHECEGDTIDKPYGEGPGEGDFLSDTVWESAFVTSRWLEFPARRTWKFRIPRWENEGRPFVEMHGYVSAAAVPNQQVHCGLDYCEPADNWTKGVGNLVEFSHVSPGNIRVTNDTCSPFFLRVVLRAGDPPRDSGAPARDADARSE